MEFDADAVFSQLSGSFIYFENSETEYAACVVPGHAQFPV
jgi:hypothetical protein